MQQGSSLAVARLPLARHALAGQVAVVTGAGRGIGREVARALAWLGSSVVIATRSDTGLETAELIRRDGGEAVFLRTDVGSAGDIANLAEQTLQRFGKVDILVNNAIVCPVKAVLEMEDDMWDQVLSVNLTGAFRTCKRFLPAMLASKSGTIVNMISTDALPHLSAYIASKQGLMAFSQSLAAEVGAHSVKVIAFAPGFVDTPGLNNVAAELAPRMGTRKERFLGLNFHKAYQGTMPAEDAGAATAYLIAALAREYHGEVVDVYTVLERANFLETGPAAAAPPASTDVPGAIALCRRLQTVLDETEAEFGRLPLVFRPLARNGFKHKSGKGGREWAESLALLAATLEQQAQTGSLTPTFRDDWSALSGTLKKLAKYYAEVPDEMAHFSKDPEVLAQVRRVMAERTAVVWALHGELERMVPR